MEIANYMHMEVLGSRVTAAIGIKEEENAEVAYVGMSFCSPVDQFSKKTGRAIAEGRLKTDNHLYRLVLDPEKKVSVQVREAFNQSVMDSDLRLPYWIVPREL